MRIKTLTLLLLAFCAFGPLNASVVPTEPTTETSTEQEALAAMQTYKESLAAMTSKERRQVKRQQRKAVKQALKDHSKSDGDSSVILAVILAVILPPLGVLVWEGELTSKFWIALLLTLLFYLPGLIYALLTILG